MVDVGVSIKVEDFLIQNRYDTLCVRNLNPRMPDSEILELATKEKRIVITMDKDFGELIYNSGKNHSGVLLLRLEDETADNKLNTVKMIFETHLNDLENNFCVYQNGRLRIKRR